MLLFGGANNLLFADWRAVADCEEPSRRKKASVQQNEEFYRALKESAKRGSASDVLTSADFKFSGYIPAEAAQSDERLLAINSRIEHNKRVELYAVLGVELSNVKYSYIRNKCDKCCYRKDIYKVISCQKCVKSNDIKAYFTHVEDIVKYSKDYINFLIRIAKMCMTYPKLVYASVSSADLKRNLKYVDKKMEEEREDWQLSE